MRPADPAELARMIKWLLAIGAGLVASSFVGTSKAATSTGPGSPPSPQPPRPAGYRTAGGSDIDSYVTSQAWSMLPGTIGDRRSFDYNGQSYLVQIEWHYHPPGGTATPWGWHHGSSVYVRA